MVSVASSNKIFSLPIGILPIVGDGKTTMECSTSTGNKWDGDNYCFISKALAIRLPPAKKAPA